MRDSPAFSRSTVASRGHLAVKTISTPSATCSRSRSLRSWSRPSDFLTRRSSGSNLLSGKDVAVVRPSSVHVSVNRSDFANTLMLIKELTQQLKIAEDERTVLLEELDRHRKKNDALHELGDSSGCRTTTSSRKDSGTEMKRNKFPNGYCSYEDASIRQEKVRRNYQQVDEQSEFDLDLDLTSELQHLKDKTDSLLHAVTLLRSLKESSDKRLMDQTALQCNYASLQAAHFELLKRHERTSKELEEVRRESLGASSTDSREKVRILETFYDTCSEARKEVNGYLSKQTIKQDLFSEEFNNAVQKVDECIKKYQSRSVAPRTPSDPRTPSAPRTSSLSTSKPVSQTKR